MKVQRKKKKGTSAKKKKATPSKYEIDGRVYAPWLDKKKWGQPGTLQGLLDEARKFNASKRSFYVLGPTPNDPSYYVAGSGIPNVLCCGTRDPRLYPFPGLEWLCQSGRPELPTGGLRKARRGRRTPVNQHYFANEVEMCALPTDELVSRLTDVAMTARQENGLPPSAGEYEKARNSARRFVRNLRRPKQRRTKLTNSP